MAQQSLLTPQIHGSIPVTSKCNLLLAGLKRRNLMKIFQSLIFVITRLDSNSMYLELKVTTEPKPHWEILILMRLFRPLFLFSRKQLKYMFINNYRRRDSNRGPQVCKATTPPTSPQRLGTINYILKPGMYTHGSSHQRFATLLR